MTVELELMQWGDGTIRLSYEDWKSGKDRVFILNADGTAHESTQNEDGTETLREVNLIDELRLMIL
jgi:hypothetical protein